MTEKEKAYKKISDLVERFTDQYDSYKKADYNETQTRRDFIDPFFKALGWDIDNENGYAEAYREVIHEDKLKIGKATKAPDYSFRLVGGKRLFFVEAKKPTVVVKDEIQPAYQVRRYGWSAKLPISIITDFEEFAIYDCTKKPNPTDKASVARIKYFTYKDYLLQFDFFWDTVSKEKVLRGSFDKYVQSDTHKKGTATVDKEFLQSLDNWRTLLATSISRNNIQLDEDEINFAVQQTIDRIIFLRIAEDRKIEPYETLKGTIITGEYYQNVFKLFIQADNKYNSGLFDFTKDKLSSNLVIENKVVKKIINELYYPESPYEFSVLSVEILGSAYEQFLGKVIRITPSHSAKVEEKPEVRKAGGVYYTPQYIVDYIVKNTVGKLIENKTPKEVSKIKIVDPACGSGSFLIGAYQYLLDWHINYYTKNKEAAKKDKALTATGVLETKIKKQILLNNIFGVDIDVNAVEVTKLSLLLKCMEGETEASINNQMKLFHERVLPTLDDNIKSGNSLIDTDFYDNQLDFGEEKKIKPFNWQKAFPSVFNRITSSEKEDLKAIATKAKEHAKKAMEYASELEEKLSLVSEQKIEYNKKYSGGFDVVIGNPPYVRIHEMNETVKSYFKRKYQSAENQFDLYQLFYEKGINLLDNRNGLLGFITPNKFCITNYGRQLRKIIFEETGISQIVDCTNSNVFGKVSTYPFILILSKKKTNENTVELIEDIGGSFKYVTTKLQSKLLKGKEKIFTFKDNEKSLDLISKIESFRNEKLFEVYRGRGTSKDLLEQGAVPSITNKEISKYGNFTKVYYRDKEKFTNDFDYKIVMKKICYTLECSIDLSGQINPINTVYVIKPINASINIKTLLGILNSKLLSFFARTKYASTAMRGGYIELRVFEVEKLPIKLILPKQQEEIIKLVDQLLHLNQDKAEAKLESKVLQIQNKIDYCEEKINQLVYELYELTEEEIKIVEGK